jgi:hypothetical protein
VGTRFVPDPVLEIAKNLGKLMSFLSFSAVDA